MGNGPWGACLFLLAEIADLLGLPLVPLVHIVHYRGDALEVGEELISRYLLAGFSALLTGVLRLVRQFPGHLNALGLHCFARTTSATLHLLVVGLRSDVA
jgi:hypothetical protein